MPKVTDTEISAVERSLADLRTATQKCEAVQSGEKFTDKLGGEVTKVFSDAQKKTCSDELEVKLAEIQGIVGKWTAV